MDAFEERVGRLGRALAIYETFRTGQSSWQSPAELLAEHADLQDLLEPMLSEPEPYPSLAERSPAVSEPRALLVPGDQIGPYRVIEEIGDGGMGTVYLVEQDQPVRRRAALKHIKLGMDTREVVRRFELERQALAMMQHPCIAQVFDAGTSPGGRPYFVMEYVPGQDLTTYCDARRLITRTRLELFARVCDAVHHAHQKGVIHRDLKPSNILVVEQDTGPTPKIIDFGIAKAVEGQAADATHLTRSGQVIGTPEYMSPEQARSGGEDVDTRSDVYSLGIVLYELLVGALPFEAAHSGRAGIAALLADICDNEPKRPSTRIQTGNSESKLRAGQRQTGTASLQRELRGDLDWIVLKAIAKSREQRYGSAADLAAEVRRFLADEPIAARPPSAAYRLRKFVRRYRAQVAAAALVLVTLVVGLVTSALLYLDAEVARRAAEQHAATANEVTDYLVGVFEEALPSSSLGETVQVLDVLDQGVVRLDGRVIDPVVRGRLLGALGQVYSALGSYDQAEKLLAESWGIAGEQQSDSLQAYEVAVTLANVHASQGNFQAAKRMFEAVTAQLRDDGETTSLRVAYATTRIAFCAARLGDRKRARVILGTAEQLAEQATGSMNMRIQVINDLAGVDFELERFEPAKEKWLIARRLLRELYPGGHPRTAKIQLQLGSCLTKLRDQVAANAAIAEAIREIERFYGAEHYFAAYPLQAHAEMLRQEGQRSAAADYYRKCIDRLRRAVGAQNPSLGRMLASLGLIEFELFRLIPARKAMEEALAIFRARFRGDNLDVAAMLCNLGAVMASQTEHEAADAYLQESVAMLRRLGSIRVVPALNQLVTLRIRQQRYADARRICVEILQREDLDKLDTVIRATCRSTVALVDNLQGRPESAEKSARMALAEFETAGVRADLRLASAHYNLGWALRSLGKTDAACLVLRRSIEVYQQAAPDGHPLEAYPQDMLGTVLFSGNEYHGALPHLRRAHELRRRYLPDSAHFRIVSAHNLAALQYKLGEHVAARQLIAEAVRLRRVHFPTPNHDLASGLLWGARIELALQDFAKAERLVRESRDAYASLLPTGHWIAAMAASVHGEVRMRRDDLDGARELLETALRDMRPGSPGHRATLVRLVELHERREDKDLAAKYRKQLLER